MAESWFSLSRADQAEALEVAAAQTGRPPHLLEKDIWVVWTLSAIYKSNLSKKLTFKGGTSLSKVYQIIDRFSEDIDLTYDIREVVPDLLQKANPIPTTSSQAKKVTDAVRARLPDWIESQVKPILMSALQSDGLEARLANSHKTLHNTSPCFLQKKTMTKTGSITQGLLAEQFNWYLKVQP